MHPHHQHHNPNPAPRLLSHSHLIQIPIDMQRPFRDRQEQRHQDLTHHMPILMYPCPLPARLLP